MTRLPELRKAVGDRALLRALHFFSENRRMDAMLKVLQEMNAPSLEAIKDANTPRMKKIVKRDEYAASVIEEFLAIIRESGDSSWELLQNIYSPRNPAEQGLTLALALTRNFLEGEGDYRVRDGGLAALTRYMGQGACRVHGGGFAGTIQAYVPMERLEDYRKLMEGVFGAGALTVLRIRALGAIEVFP